MGNFLNALFVTKNCGGLLWAESVLNYSLTLTLISSLLRTLRLGEQLHLEILTEFY